MTITVNGYYDFSCAHRAPGDLGKCRRLHGHNYRVTLHVTGPSPDVNGRIVDFDVLKCMFKWIEENWDHRLLLWNKDPVYIEMVSYPETSVPHDAPELMHLLALSVMGVPFDTSTENMARHLLEAVGPAFLYNSKCWLSKVEVMETRKFGAIVTADRPLPFNPIVKDA